ncbi:MAG: hypothetical protein J2P31_15710 [Blastocatellia bacterium]|nr:hypothetical protein [Blastocatellia bacterium]
MAIFLTLQIGRGIISAVEILREIVQLVIGVAIGLVILLLAVRLLTDVFKLNPFGSIYQSVRRPTDELYHRMRTSNFYYPLKRAFGFDPTAIMILIALAVVGYVVYIVSNYLFQIMTSIGFSLISFSRGDIFVGLRILVGTVLLAVIFFLMTLMTIVFVNWLFGMMRRAAFWSMERLSPLLRIFEFSGMLAGFSFIILWIALIFAAAAVNLIFLRSA